MNPLANILADITRRANAVTAATPPPDPRPAAERLLAWAADNRTGADPDPGIELGLVVARAYIAREAAVAGLVAAAKEVAGALELQPAPKLGGLDCHRLAAWLRAAVAGAGR